MVDWLAQLHRRTSHSDGSSSSSLEPTFRINNPRTRGRRVTSGGSIIRAPRRNVLSGDFSLSTDEIGFEGPVLHDLNTSSRGTQGDGCVIFVEEAERRLVEPVEQFGIDTSQQPLTGYDLKELTARNLDTVNRMSDDEWMLR